MNRALIDTDIFTEMIKGVNPIVAIHAADYRTTFSRYTVSAATMMEIVRGYQQKQASRQLQAFLNAMNTEEVIPFDQTTAELAGQIAGDLARTGQPIGVADPMIAATALLHRLDLVTGNTNHFERVRQLGYSLSLIDWRT